MKKIFIGLMLTVLMLVCFEARSSSANGYDLSSPASSETAFDNELNGMNIFFGNLHSHTKISDGQGTPDEAMQWARYGANFDFYILTDHAESIVLSEWKAMNDAADTYNEDGVFVAMRGFEWSHSLFGHLCVFNTQRYTNSTINPFLVMFYFWIDCNNALAQFNHLGREKLVFRNFKYFSPVADNFFAVETGNKNDGNNDFDYLNYYPNVLDDGWRVAPSSNQDNHSLKANSHRTVIISDYLSRDRILDAMRARRIYSSDDPNMEIIFKHDDAWMGSQIVTSEEILKFMIWVRDDEPIKKVTVHTNQGAVAAVLIPEAGVSEVKWEPEIARGNSTYFYIQVEEENLYDADLETQIAVTAPIWFVKE